MAEPTLILAAIAGLASFLSPCMLPVIPAFLAQLAGTSHIRYKHFGEGAYGETEKKVQELLAERDRVNQ